jgi:two-component system, LuxR family, response regulator FixJ
MKRIRRSPRSIGKPADACTLAAEFPGRERLTPREVEVLALIAGGASNKEAGRRLGISPRTIEVHRAHIMEKLGAKNSVDLVHKVLGERR